MELVGNFYFIFQMQKIQEIGGKTVQKTIKFAMEAIMTDELTQKVVWTLGAEHLPKICKFTFPYLIIGTYILMNIA